MNGHNHPPSCCCAFDPRDIEAGDIGSEHLHPLITCPTCVEHGELAALDRECPSCHTHGDHPHTEYCNIAYGWRGATTPPDEVACAGTAHEPNGTPAADHQHPTATPAHDAPATDSATSTHHG